MRLENLLADLRLALRMLARRPAFAVVAIATLALGIGANAAIFSVISAVFLRPLPFPAADQLVWATQYFPQFHRAEMFTPEYAAWHAHQTAFNAIETYGVSVGVNLAIKGQAAERVQAGHVTPGYFHMLGVAPQLGRSFDVHANDRVAVISDALWRGYFHADADVLSRDISIDGAPATVIGVMPPGFVDPGAPDAGLWLADAVSLRTVQPGRAMSFLAGVIGRLKPGVTLEQARADLTRIARAMDAAYPAPWAGYHSAARVQITPLQNELANGSKTAIFVLAGAVGFVLLIVCANLSSLFLARASERKREMATRAALGASRSRLVHLLLAESMLLGAAGGLLGLLLAHLSVAGLAFLLPAAIPQSLAIDWRVVGFTAACALAAAFLFGLAPAYFAAKTDLNESLKQSAARTSERVAGFAFSSALTTLQIALSLVLVAGAGLLLRSFYTLMSVDPGFDARHVLLGEVSLAPAGSYGPEQQIVYFERSLQAVRRLPGVESAAVTDESPLAAFQSIASGLQAEGEPQSDATVVPTSASADYFRTLRIPLRAGRFFDARDGANTPRVAIVNEALARILFQKRSPIGARVRIGEDKDDWVRVVGVVANIRHRALDSRIWPEIFFPFEQRPASWMSLVVRTTGDPIERAGAVRRAISGVDGSQPLFQVQSLESRLANSVAERRRRAILLCAFAALALGIAMVGVYGVLAYSVARRMHEMGVRIALGARREQILALVFTGGLRMVAAGVVLGLAGAFALTRFVRSLLFGITPTDPLTFAGVCILVIVTALLAMYAPARQASRADAMMVLRDE